MVPIDDVTTYLRTRGADLIGFANIDGLSSGKQTQLPCGIALGVALDPHVISEITTGPTRPYYAEYERANHLLETLGQEAVTFLHGSGYQASSLAVTDQGIDPTTDSTALPHKTVATRAGLGWIGKCALLVTASFGSAIRLTTVMTDAPLPVGTPMDTSRCGTCMACVEACPGQAPSGENWEVGRHRDQFFNVTACRRMAREMAITNIQIQNTICGICIAVCPWTQRYLRRC